MFKYMALIGGGGVLPNIDRSILPCRRGTDENPLEEKMCCRGVQRPLAKEQWVVLRLAQCVRDVEAHVQHMQSQFEKAVHKAKKMAHATLYDATRKQVAYTTALQALRTKYRRVVVQLAVVERVQRDALELAQVKRLVSTHNVWPVLTLSFL
jgi:hypothetical protein